MYDIKNYQQVIFDCDGVILDSNQIKSKAFADALVDEDPKLIDEFLYYHQQNGGVSRFVKFEYFYKIIKAQKDYQVDRDNALKKYSKLSLEGLLSCNEIKGIRNILTQLGNYNIDSFVVSGGEQTEVRTVLKKKDLSHYFKKIYGSPATKKENLSAIKPVKSLYFGDAKSDYEAASVFGMDFVYINGASEWTEGIKFCQQNNIAMFKDFTEFEGLK
ncbi:HAD family hydrolase [Candidatus Woesearchaeota archaeon]|nr:HAD family hydrolase [Candidatus Woesearchaeota archaeon]